MIYFFLHETFPHVTFSWRNIFLLWHSFSGWKFFLVWHSLDKTFSSCDILLAKYFIRAVSSWRNLTKRLIFWYWKRALDFFHFLPSHLPAKGQLTYAQEYTTRPKVNRVSEASRWNYYHEKPSPLFYCLCHTLRRKIVNESEWDNGKIGIMNPGRITKWLILWLRRNY